MVTTRLAEMLIRQIGSELTAHMSYMAISFYFKRLNLDGWAKVFYDQSMEEAQHALKIMNFLDDVDVEFDLPQVGGATSHFASPREAVQAALASEQRVSREFQAMAVAATEDKDFRSFQFLQWFIEEQVEEEAKMEKLLDLIDSGINLFQAEPLLDRLDS